MSPEPVTASKALASSQSPTWSLIGWSYFDFLFNLVFLTGRVAHIVQTPKNHWASVFSFSGRLPTTCFRVSFAKLIPLGKKTLLVKKIKNKIKITTACLTKKKDTVQIIDLTYNKAPQKLFLQSLAVLCQSEADYSVWVGLYTTSLIGFQPKSIVCFSWLYATWPSWLATVLEADVLYIIYLYDNITMRKTHARRAGFWEGAFYGLS